MAWWNFVGDIFKGGKDVAEVFVENKEAKGRRTHEEKIADVGRDMASLNQFAAEFKHRSTTSKWEAFVNGLNRLPRPLLTLAVISFFILAPFYPERFFEIAKAYEVIPTGYWGLLSVIIGFYFGGRMQLKSQDFTIQKSAVLTAAKELVEIKKEFRQIDDELESTESKIYDIAVLNAGQAPKNKVVEKWLQQRKQEVGSE